MAKHDDKPRRPVGLGEILRRLTCLEIVWSRRGKIPVTVMDLRIHASRDIHPAPHGDFVNVIRYEAIELGARYAFSDDAVRCAGLSNLGVYELRTRLLDMVGKSFDAAVEAMATQKPEETEEK